MAERVIQNAINSPKKGIIISLSVFMLASLLVLLAYTVGAQNGEKLDAAWPAMNTQHASASIGMAGDGVRSIMAANRMGAGVSGLRASYWSPYPVPTNYSQDLLAWKYFASGFSGLSAPSLDTANSTRPQAYVRPQDIMLDWVNSSFFAVPANATYSAGNLSAYHLNLTMNGSGAPTLVWNNQTSLIQASPGALRLNITVYNADWSASATSDTYVNRSVFNEIAVVQDGATRAWIRILPEAKFQLLQNASTMDFNITLEMAGPAAQPRVELADRILSVGGGTSVLYNTTVRLD